MQLAFRNVLCSNSAVQHAPYVNSLRTIVYSESGAILERPERVSYGLLKVLIAVGASVFIGGAISRKAADILEEHDLFVPDEDDD